jgi:hypothetical protein
MNAIFVVMNRPTPRTARIGARGLVAVLLLALVAVPMARPRRAEAAPAQPAAAAPGPAVATEARPGAGGGPGMLGSVTTFVEGAPWDVHTKAGDTVVPEVVFDAVPLMDALHQLAQMSELNIQFEPAVFHLKGADGTPIPPPVVTERWRQVTPLQAMEALLVNYGWHYGWRMEATTNKPDIAPPGKETNTPRPRFETSMLVGDNSWRMEANPTNPIVILGAGDPKTTGPQSTKFNLTGNAPAGGAGKAGQNDAGSGAEVITVTLDNIELPSAIRNLANLVNLNIQFDPQLLNQKAADGTPIPLPKVKEKWADVTPRQALQKLLDQYGWELTQTPGNPILRVVAKK